MSPSKVFLLTLALFGLVALASATVHFSEDFDDKWTERWVYSKSDDASGNAGKFKHTAGKYYNDAVKDAGIQTSQDARFYKLSSVFPKFTNDAAKPLVIQYSIKQEQVQDCAGSYIKVGPSGIDQEAFEGETPYNIMFGPDVCGATKRVHFIINYKGENHLIKREVRPETDVLTHLYTAIIHPNQTYEIRIDNELKQSGELVEDWDLLPPKQIPDPDQSKPADWVDAEYMADPEAVKPDNWDDIPKSIADPEATKPEVAAAPSVTAVLEKAVQYSKFTRPMAGHGHAAQRTGQRLRHGLHGVGAHRQRLQQPQAGHPNSLS